MYPANIQVCLNYAIIIFMYEHTYWLAMWDLVHIYGPQETESDHRRALFPEAEGDTWTSTYTWIIPVNMHFKTL